MKKLCRNLDREDGLETVLEVPIPEEIFISKNRAWQNMKSWMKPNAEPTSSSSSVFGGKTTEIQLLLGVIGAPLLPFPISSHNNNQPIISRNIKHHNNIEGSMAKYIVKQYVAAVGGERALNSVESMYAMGQVRVGSSEFWGGEEGVMKKKKKKKRTTKEVAAAAGEMGGFVVWQKKPELWCLELVVSGYKISAGSDGKVAWRQTPWHHSHASRGPPRPLRRLIQGIDPRSTANLFNNSICIGEKTVNNEECFTLKLEAESASLKARSSSNVEIIQHTLWGHFSQRTGLLVQLQDSYLLKLKSSPSSQSCDAPVFWETNMESLIQDYRAVDGIQIAHAGKTSVSLSRFGAEGPNGFSRTRMEETWKIEEVDFNIKGLSMECFLPPSDLKRGEQHKAGEVATTITTTSTTSNNNNNNANKLPFKIRQASFKISASKVAAVNLDDSSDESESDEDVMIQE
ncbi:uncharacterized protein LOC130941547 [Arachis stenosperma]|uniref:uncharacterized protein LOC130941547 n=1 Tax=Arachis stenosperma TaxID=217475 RepID=UPI0025AC4808|nr:uncharacterized protein LOC130941547 [Arachis stenosperma]